MRKHPYLLWLLAALCVFQAYTGPAQAQQYLRFGPANGVLVGTTSSPQTTAATNANIIAMWSGTCNSASFLRGDGSCASPAGAGTVTSVALTVPTGLGVTGSPITGAGTLGITTALNGVLRGTGTGFATSTSSNITSLWTGTCDATTFLRGDGSCQAPAGAGTVTSVGLTMPTGFTVGSSPITGAGTIGVTTTLSGLLAGTGSGFIGAVAADVTAEFSGTCNSTTFLRGDGSCQAAGGGTAANPTGVIGLTAVNGVASTYPRSDSAPALSQAIAPTWTAKHIFSNTSSFTTGQFALSATAADPFMQWYENDGALNNKNWALGALNEQFVGAVMNDNGTSYFPWITVDRTGVVVDSINLSATSVALNGTSIRDAAILTSGTLPVARGGTGATSSTGTGNVVLSASPTLTGTTTAATVAATAVTVGGSNVCRENGTNCPTGAGTAFAVIGVSGSTCSVSFTFDTAGVSSCTYNAPGSYDINLSVGTSSWPTCTSTVHGGFAIMSVAGIDADSVRVNRYNASGVATDGNFTIMCMGN